MSIDLKYGLLAAGGLLAFMTLIYLLAGLTGDFSWLAWLQLCYPGLVVGAVVSAVYYKRKNTGELTFGQGLYAGLAVTIIGSVVLAFGEFATGSYVVKDLPERAASYHGQQIAADVFHGKPPASFPDSVRLKKDELVKNVIAGARDGYKPKQRAQTSLAVCMVLGSLAAAVAAFAWRKPPPPEPA